MTISFAKCRPRPAGSLAQRTVPACEQGRRAGSPSQEQRERARQLLSQEIDFVPNTEFRVWHAAGEGGPSPATSAGHPEGQATSPNRMPKDMPAHLARLCEGDLLTAPQERYLFQRMNYLKYRANAFRSALDPDRFDSRQLEEAERWLAEANQIRDRILKANMRLVISIVKKYVTPHQSFDDMLSDGTMSLMKAVSKFDYDRGFRFSTYAYRSISRTACRSIMDHRRISQRHLQANEDINELADDHEDTSRREAGWASKRAAVERMLHGLDGRERFIISGRYALDGQGKEQSFQNLADVLGLSKERTRQLEQRAFSKLRRLVNDTETQELIDE